MAVHAPPPGLRPMSEFDPSQPAILHDRASDTIVAWTGEEAAAFRQLAVRSEDGTVRWREAIFDGWGNVLGG